METASFIGSDKNAGKTTALNFVVERLFRTTGQKTPLCITSIGINGEVLDSLDRIPKPRIRVFRDMWFITAPEHLSRVAGKYAVHLCFSGTPFSRTYVLGRALASLEIVIEGPNDKAAVLEMKKGVAELDPGMRVLIDGSIDRRFLAHPDVSDLIYLAVLISQKREHQQRVHNLLSFLTLPACAPELRELISANTTASTRSLLFMDSRVLYHGTEAPFLDNRLKEACLDQGRKAGILYLDGALTADLYRLLSPLSEFHVIMDNFTCFQNIAVSQTGSLTFKPRLSLYRSVPVRKVFVRQEMRTLPFSLPGALQVNNIFRDPANEIYV